MDDLKDLNIFDFILDIDSDIINKSSSSNLPLFFVYRREIKERKKIIKLISKFYNKMKNDNHIYCFSGKELIPFFLHVYSYDNNFIGESSSLQYIPNFCKYIVMIKRIYKENNEYIGSSVKRTINILNVWVKVDNIDCNISIDLDDYNKKYVMEINYSVKDEKTEEISHFATVNDQLLHNYDSNNTLEKVNKCILEDMYNYTFNILTLENNKKDIISRLKKIRENKNEDGK